MTSNILRLVSLFGICIIFLTGYGSGIHFVNKPKVLNKETSQLNVSCIANEPVYSTRTVLTLEIIKEDLDEPIVSINNEQRLARRTYLKKNMEVDGKIDNPVGQSYLALRITKPSVQDAGSYKCLVMFLDQDNKLNSDDVVANVTLQLDQGIADNVRNLKGEVTGLIQTVNGQKELIHTLQKQIISFKNYHSQNEKQLAIFKDVIQRQGKKLDQILSWINKQSGTTLAPIQACPDGWTFYKGDKTCLKVFSNTGNSQLFTWPETRKACQKFGGDLVQIRDEQKNTFIYNALVAGNSYGPWLGVRNAAKRGADFKYIDGSPLGTYQPWRPEQPTGHNDKDVKCVYMSVYSDNPGQWADGNCLAEGRPYLCSKPSQ